MSGTIPAERIFTKTRLCVETATYHFADNDYILWYWDDETWTGQQCIDACPVNQMDPNGNCTSVEPISKTLWGLCMA